MMELWNIVDDQMAAMEDVTIHNLEINEASIFVLDPPSSSGKVVSENNDNNRINVTWEVGDLNEDDPHAQLWLEISANLNADDFQNNLDDYPGLDSVEEYRLNSDAVISFTDPETGHKLSAHTRQMTVRVIRE
jgi:hypothetical protein